MISSCWGVLITNERTDGRTDICNCRVAFATEKPVACQVLEVNFILLTKCRQTLQWYNRADTPQFQSQKLLYIHQCPFFCLSICVQKPSKSQNYLHHYCHHHLHHQAFQLVCLHLGGSEKVLFRSSGFDQFCQIQQFCTSIIFWNQLFTDRH